MTAPIRLLALSLILSPLAIGCGSAALVRANPSGGRVALEGSYMDSVADARLLMSQHCQGRFAILAEDGRSVIDAPAPDQAHADFTCAGAIEPSHGRELAAALAKP